MTIRRSNALRTAMAEALNTQRGALAKINLRTGAPSGTGGQGTLLVTLTGDATAWGTVTDGVLTANALTSGTGVASGDVGHYEILKSDDTFLESGDVSGDGLTLVNVAVEVGQEIEGASWVNTMPFPASA